MRHGMPLWCSLNDKSKLALLKALGVKEFSEPLPVWREWYPDIIVIDGIPEGFDYGKFMRRPPSRRRN